MLRACPSKLCPETKSAMVGCVGDLVLNCMLRACPSKLCPETKSAMVGCVGDLVLC